MPRKPKFGQHFLVDPAASSAIAESLGDLSARTVIEIGPGRGAITGLLARRAARLVAIELDHEMALMLLVQFADSGNVEVLERDVLEVDFAGLLSGEQGSEGPKGAAADKLVIIGNLPYYITSDILLKIFAAHPVVSQAVVMVQREVADRVAAHHGTRDYGLLSATAQLYARVEKLFTLPPSAFSPPPDVHSTVLRLTMRPRFQELGVEPGGFVNFLRSGFAQKRKTLANNLRAAGYPPGQVSAAFKECGMEEQIRAEAVPLEAAAQLYRALIAS